MAVTLHEKMNQVLVQLDGVLLGKQHSIRLALACVMSRGHLLLEDLPGMGKTTLAHGLARVLGLEDQRLQFTADMLPADIIGVSVYRADSGSFEFHPGPVFCQLLLADEINRATPKTQSALLEAMAEQQVSSDGRSYPLQKPFFVIATQNPVTQYGTFPLPESQLDRFAMRLSLGYPAAEVERRLLQQNGAGDALAGLKPLLVPEELLRIQEECDQIHASNSVISYLQRLVQATRERPEFSLGVSPRGALALLRVARALAWLNGREHLVPEDIQAVAVPVMGHRVQATESRDALAGQSLVAELLRQVDVLE